MSLDVVYAADTGHVLGALAVVHPGGHARSVTELAGPALPRWVSMADGTVVELVLPASRLAAAVVDDQPQALSSPLDFGVSTEPDGSPRPALRPLDPWDLSVARVPPSGVKVTVPWARQVASPLLVLIAGAERTPVLSGEIPAGGTEAILGAALPAGSYGALVLVAGWAGQLARIELP